MVLLQDAFQSFLAEDRAPATTETYRKVLGKLVAALGPERPLAHVSHEDLAFYFSRLRSRSLRYADHPRRPPERGRLSSATLTKHLKSARAFFNYCCRRGWLAESPAADVKLRRYSRPPGSSKALSPSDLRAMVAFARTKRCHRERDHAILLFLADTGCRVGGCASLTLDGLRLSAFTAFLREKGDTPHRVFFGPETASALRRWLEIRPHVPSRHVWINQYGQPFAANGLSMMVRRVAQESIGRSIGPHAIRHRVGQAWAGAGLNAELVALKLGHADIAVTLEHYFNQDFARLQAASSRLALVALQDDPLLSAGGPVPDDPKIIRFPTVSVPA